MEEWLTSLPSEIGYAIVTAALLGGLAWLWRRLHRPGTPQVATPGAPPIPALLPRAPQRFVNRERELAALDELANSSAAMGRTSVAVLSGMHGVGKSAVGSLWTHRNRKRFPGGVLWADFSRRRHPDGVRVSDVLADFLRELGTSDVAMPTTLDARQALFRRLTSDRRLLVLLDDVDQPAQAINAIPSGAGSLVVVTSAGRLEELVRDGAEALPLEPLSRKDAQELLESMTGPERLATDPSATQTIVNACGGLPIALCVCGAKLAVDKERTARWLANQLDDGSERLATLSPPGEFSVSGVFTMAYRNLSKPTARLYRLLGLHPGSDVAAPAAAAQAELSLDETNVLLGELEAAFLLAADARTRFRPHDLVREHMRSCARVDEAADTADAAVNRAIDWYVAAAQAADRAVVDDRLRLEGHDRVAAPNLPWLTSPAEAFEWFEVERHNVMAAQRAALDRERFERVWQVAEALWPLCASHKRFAEWVDSHRAAIVAGERLGDLRVIARMRSQLARAFAELGEHQDAREQMDAALTAAADAGITELVASVTEFGGVCQLRANDLDSALASFVEARGRFAASGLTRGVVLQDYHVGWCLLCMGRAFDAVEPLERARDGMRDLGDEINVGRSLVRLGEAFANLGLDDRARSSLLDAIDVLERAGVQFEQAEAHEALADLADGRHASETATEHRQSAYRLYRELGHPRADVMLTMLGSEDMARPAA